MNQSLDLLGCAHLNEAILLLSVLSKTYFTNPMWRKSSKPILANTKDDGRNWELHRTLPLLSFETLKEIDSFRGLIIKDMMNVIPIIKKTQSCLSLSPLWRLVLGTMLKFFLAMLKLNSQILTTGCNWNIKVYNAWSLS